MPVHCPLWPRTRREARPHRQRGDTTPESFTPRIATTSGEIVVAEVNDRPADTLAQTLAVKRAHWTLKVPHSPGMRALPDDVADRLRESSDPMAERAVITGGTAHGTREAAAKKRGIADRPPDIEQIAALTERFNAHGTAVRRAIDVADEAGDEETADLVTACSRTLERDAWVIGANSPPGRSVAEIRHT